jgi:hypothetical protein
MRPGQGARDRPSGSVPARRASMGGLESTGSHQTMDSGHVFVLP